LDFGFSTQDGARNYDKDGFWRRGRLPIDPVALDVYRDWKDANPNNPTSGVVVKGLMEVTKAACLPTRIKAPHGKIKSGFKPRPMRRAELASQLARVCPQFDEELLRHPPPRQAPCKKNQSPRPSNKSKKRTPTARLPPPAVAKKKCRAAPVSSTAHATDAQAASVSASQPRKFPPCPHCNDSYCHSGKCV
jgi:hypothetical protein